MSAIDANDQSIIGEGEHQRGLILFLISISFYTIGQRKLFATLDARDLLLSFVIDRKMAAHLPGAAEAFRLVAMVVQAAQTARRNKRTCRRLARRVEMLGELLQQLQWSVVMRRPVTGRPLAALALEETLRRAHQLVVSCQGAGGAQRFLMGAKHARELRSVEEEIDSSPSSAMSTAPVLRSMRAIQLQAHNFRRAQRYVCT